MKLIWLLKSSIFLIKTDLILLMLASGLNFVHFIIFAKSLCNSWKSSSFFWYWQLHVKFFSNFFGDYNFLGLRERDLGERLERCRVDLRPEENLLLTLGEAHIGEKILGCLGHYDSLMGLVSTEWMLLYAVMCWVMILSWNR